MSQTEDRTVDDAPPATAKDGDGELIARTTTINRPREELYAFWRDFGNLARVLENVEEVRVIDERRSHWRVSAPAGESVEWDAIITNDEPGRSIAWRSAENADIDNSGQIEFRDSSAGRGTEVTATIRYDSPGGAAGRLVAKLFQKEPKIQARRELRRFKQLMETGEIATAQSPRAS